MAALLGNIGAGLLEDGQPDSASSYLERARALAAVIGDLRVEANAVGGLAGAPRNGATSPARVSSTRARSRCATASAIRGHRGRPHNLGLLAQRLGDLEEARRQFETALALNRHDGRDEVAATNLVNLAGLASLAGDFARAEALYRDALAIWRARESWADVRSHCTVSGSSSCGAVTTRPLASRCARRSRSTHALAQSPMSWPCGAISRRAGRGGDLQGARDELSRAQRRADSTRAPPGARAGIALARADLALELNTLTESQRLYARAEALYRLAAEPAARPRRRRGGPSCCSRGTTQPTPSLCSKPRCARNWERETGAPLP